MVFVKPDIRYEPRSRATSHAYGGSTSGSLVDPHARVLSSLVRAPVRLSPRTRAMTLHTGSANQTTQSIGGDFGDDAATLARAAAWRRENPELAERQAEFFHRLWDNPGGAVKKETLLALELSPDYRHECVICDRDYMLRRGYPCCRD